MGVFVRAASCCDVSGEASATELCCDGLRAVCCSAVTAGSSLAAISLAMGLLSLLKSMCGSVFGARLFFQGAGGVLVGES